jgi:prophage maintenance system killer protein
MTPSPPPWADLISAERIDQLHGEGLARYGGDPGVLHRGCVDGALGSAWTAEGYTRQSQSINGLAFAAHLLFYLVRDSCYVDGNKRVSWTSAMEVLHRLNLSVSATDEEAETFCLQVLAHEVDGGAEVQVWLAERLVAIADG